jgi:hypothetical protein
VLSTICLVVLCCPLSKNQPITPKRLYLQMLHNQPAMHMFPSPLLRNLQINLPIPDIPLSYSFHYFFSFSFSFTSSNPSTSSDSYRQPTNPSILTTNSFTLKGLATQSSIPAFNAVSLCSCLAFADTAIMGICVEILPSFSHVRI